MYVKRNIEAHLRNHCCRGKAENITYFCVCVCVRALERGSVCIRVRVCSLAYPARKARPPYFIICGLSGFNIFLDIFS